MSVHKYKRTRHWKSSGKVHELRPNSRPEGRSYTDMKYRRGFCSVCIIVATLVVVKQIVVPKDYRDHVNLAHETIVREHLGAS